MWREGEEDVEREGESGGRVSVERGECGEGVSVESEVRVRG